VDVKDSVEALGLADVALSRVWDALLGQTVKADRILKSVQTYLICSNFENLLIRLSLHGSEAFC
jgi:hypothetical protein